MPTIFPSLSPTGTTNTTGPPGNLWWDLCFFSGSIPIALASVFEEKFFGETEIHLVYMLAWSTLWQTIAIIICFPVSCIPVFGSNTFSNFFQYQWYGMQCFAGYPIPTSVCPGCECESSESTKWILLFTFSYILANFSLLGVVKEGSATFSFLVSALILPLTEFCFAMKFIVGEDVETLSPFNYGALVILIVGVVMFRFFTARNKKETPHENLIQSETDQLLPKVN